MHVRQHQQKIPAGIRTLILGGTMSLTLMLAGCSAVNMTGFSMPVFGLTKKPNAGDSMTTSSLPEEEKKAEQITSQ